MNTLRVRLKEVNTASGDIQPHGWESKHSKNMSHPSRLQRRHVALTRTESIHTLGYLVYMDLALAFMAADQQRFHGQC